MRLAGVVLVEHPVDQLGRQHGGNMVGLAGRPGLKAVSLGVASQGAGAGLGHDCELAGGGQHGDLLGGYLVPAVKQVDARLGHRDGDDVGAVVDDADGGGLHPGRCLYIKIAQLVAAVSRQFEKCRRRP